MYGDYNPYTHDRFSWSEVMHTFSKGHVCLSVAMTPFLTWRYGVDQRDFRRGGLLRKAYWVFRYVCTFPGPHLLIKWFNTRTLVVPFSVWAHDPEWQPRKIRATLLEHGVRTWHWSYWNGTYQFWTNRRQSRFAQHLLLSYGVPVRGALLKGGIPRGWQWIYVVGDDRGKYSRPAGRVNPWRRRKTIR